MKKSNASAQKSAGRDLVKSFAKTGNAIPEKMPAIRIGEHGRYQIKSAYVAGEYLARAFPKPPTDARGVIAQAEGESEDAAIASLREILDQREVQRLESRRTEPQTGAVVPNTEEFAEAIGQITLTQPQRAMLKALAIAGGDGLTEAKLANSAGFKSRVAARRAFARAGLLVAHYLSIDETAIGSSDDMRGSTVLGLRGAGHDPENPGNWILHTELRDALRNTQ